MTASKNSKKRTRAIRLIGCAAVFAFISLLIYAYEISLNNKVSQDGGSTGQPAKIMPDAAPKMQIDSLGRIDTTTDKSMVDSLDQIASKLDEAGKQTLNDDFEKVMNSMLLQAEEKSMSHDQAIEEFKKSIHGKTAEELSETASMVRQN